MKKRTWLLFGLMVLLQLAVPAKMIYDQEDILATGSAWKFRTEPVDPNDPFRGKYVALNFKEEEIIVSKKQQWRPGETIYLTLGTDINGFAKVKAVSKSKPESETAYLKAKLYYASISEDHQLLRINNPFDKYFMEESKAPEAETVHRETAADTSQVAYALVKIKDGSAVLENVFINDIPIKEVVEKARVHNK